MNTDWESKFGRYNNLETKQRFLQIWLEPLKELQEQLFEGTSIIPNSGGSMWITGTLNVELNEFWDWVFIKAKQIGFNPLTAFIAYADKMMRDAFVRSFDYNLMNKYEVRDTDQLIKNFTKVADHIMEKNKKTLFLEAMDKVLVIYHREDNDGACSAGIINAFLDRYANQYPYSKLKFEGVNYADLSKYWKEYTDAEIINDRDNSKIGKWCNTYDTVFMVDISFNEVTAMNKFYEVWGSRFIWCDHHAPIIEQSRTNDFGKAPGIRDTSRSALLNTWDYMNIIYEVANTYSPWIKKLSDYDSWAYTRMPEYDALAIEELFDFNTGMTFDSNLNPKWYAEWVSNLWNKRFVHGEIATEAQEHGNVIRRHDKARMDRAVRSNGMTWTLSDHRKVCVLFTTEKFNSTQWGAVEDPTIKNGAIIKHDAKNNNWTLSLYNFDDTDEFHCGEYLKAKYNGGGHKGAAGCTLSHSDVITMMEEKAI